MTTEEAWQAYLSAAARELTADSGEAVLQFPHYAQDGRWVRLSVAARSSWDGDLYEHGNWTAGFWFGVRWLLAHGTGRQEAADGARARLSLIAERASDTTTHDLGFLFYPSFVLSHVLGVIGDDAVEPALEAARTLVRRFNPRGAYIQAFGEIGDPRGAGTSTIDTMMNLPLLWWAHKRTGDDVFAQVARAHALTSAHAFVRADDSTSHLNHFDPQTGALLSRGTFQGAGGDSCWSRGEAWAICGFAWTYAVTGEPALLTAAERTATYFWRHLPADGVAPWDFSDGSPNATRDASASAIAALGALVLAHAHPEAHARTEHAKNAAQLLGGLGAHALERDGHEDGILQHSCYSKPHGLGVDGATAWGDFFYGLALALATGRITFDALLGASSKKGVS